MADTAIDARRRTLEEAAVEVCAYCHGVKGHGPVPVKTPEGYVHLFTQGNGSNSCASGKIWAMVEQTKQDRELFRSPKREQLQPVAPSSEPSIPADLKEEYGQCFDYDRHTLMDKPFIRGLIERIGRAEDRIVELESLLRKSKQLATIGYRIAEAEFHGHDKIAERYGRQQDDLIAELRAALAAPSGVNTKEKV